jgi:hypothetical protein
MKNARFFSLGNATRLEICPNDFSARLRAASEIFPARSLIVHQGGAGTTRRRCERACRKSLCLSRMTNPTTRRDCSALESVTAKIGKHYPGRRLRSFFDNPDVLTQNAQQLGEKIRAENGPLSACEAIERLSA